MKKQITLKEYIFIYSHWNIFVLVFAFWILSEYILNLNFQNVKAYQDYSMDISIGFLSILLTLLGLFLALPNTNYRKLMKRYSHDKIILNNILFGSVSLILFIICSIIGLSISILPYLLLYSILTTLVIAYFLFSAAMYINED